MCIIFKALQHFKCLMHPKEVETISMVILRYYVLINTKRNRRGSGIDTDIRIDLFKFNSES